jgi:hypothetical protein
VGLPPQEILAAELEYGGTEHCIAMNRTPDVALAGTVCVLSPSLKTFLDPLKIALLRAGAAVAILAQDKNAGTREQGLLLVRGDGAKPSARALVEVISHFGGIDTLVCMQTDGPIAELAMQWLRLSPVRPRVILLGPGAESRDGKQGLLQQCRTLNIDVVMVDSAAHSAQTAKNIVHLLALGSVNTFPVPG